MTETLSPVLPDTIERAARRILQTACDKGLRLATAESCTGGLLASLLTDVEGVSSAFERGYVVYSKEAKCELLHIARDVVDSCGAVSRKVAVAMAEGVLKASRADLALSVTGFAGPGAPGDEPAGFTSAARVKGARRRTANAISATSAAARRALRVLKSRWR